MSLDGFAAVLLAAGLSTRHKNGHKLMREWRGKPLMQHSVDVLRGLGLSQLVVVLGRNADDVLQRVSLDGFNVVRNEKPEAGLSQSLKAGMEALDDNVAGSFICLADMPLVNASVYEILADNFSPETSKTICAPVYGNQPGNPVLFGKNWFKPIASLQGDKGARVILKNNPDHVINVVMENDNVTADFDQDADFMRK